MDGGTVEVMAISVGAFVTQFEVIGLVNRGASCLRGAVR